MAAQPMSYNYLGNTGLRVSAICLGTMTFASETNSAAMPGTSREDAHRMLDLFAQAGGNFIDTADMYTEGQSEMIGKYRIHYVGCIFFFFLGSFLLFFVSNCLILILIMGIGVKLESG